MKRYGLIFFVLLAAGCSPESGEVTDLFAHSEQRFWEKRSECGQWQVATTVYPCGQTVCTGTSTYCARWDWFEQERVFPKAFQVVTRPDPDDEARFSVWVNEGVYHAISIGERLHFDEVGAAYERPEWWGSRR